MTTLKNVLNYIALNNLDHEIYGATTSEMYHGAGLCKYTSDRNTRLKIGFEFQKDVWYWFESFEAMDLNSDLYFCQRYNRQNGACQKSWRKGYECEKVVLEATKHLY